MERKKSQLLFNFLPDDTFNHAQNGIIGRVTKHREDRGSAVDELPERYILDRIRPRIRQWPNDVPLRAGDIELISPDGAEYEVFPRVFECRQCGAITEFSKRDFEQGVPAECGHCERRLTDTEQLQFVLVCSCGDLETVPVPTCGNCGSRHPRLRRPSSRMDDSYWVCSRCDSQIGGAYHHIYNCSRCGSGRRIKVHSSSTTFYPQSAKFVNIQDENLGALMASNSYQRETIAAYLTGIDPDAEAEEGPTPDYDEELLERLGISEEEFLEEAEDLESERGQEKQRAVDWVESTFLDEELRELGEELFEYESLIDDSKVDAETLESLYEKAPRREDIQRAVIERYRDARDRLKFSEVRLLTDFPITTVVYGYSRLNSGPDEGSELRTFEGERGRDRMFAMTAEAEAMMVSLDKEHVARWLVMNDVIDEMPDENLDRWFLRNLGRYPYYDEVDSEVQGQVARHALVLLHSTSHTLIDAVDALSGYSKESLVEYLLPHTLSFVIYKHSDTDFTLGAMHTLIESRFLELADYIDGEADVCIYDPVCEVEENGACEDCMFISNISCANGNQNLSRSTLYGGPFDDVEIRGYLDV